MLSNQLLSERYGLITEEEIMSFLLAVDGDNNLFHLLYEVEERSDVAKVRAQARTSKDVIDKIKKELEPTNLDSLKTYMDSLSATMDKALQAAAAIDFEDPEGKGLKRFFGSRIETASAIDAITATNALAKQASDTIENTLKLFLRNLEDIPGDDKAKHLEDIAGSGMIPGADKLKQGAIKAMKASRPGWGTQAMNFLRRTAAKKWVANVPNIDKALMDQFGDDIMVTSVAQLEKMRDALVATPDPEEPRDLDRVTSDTPSATPSGTPSDTPTPPAAPSGTPSSTTTDDTPSAGGVTAKTFRDWLSRQARKGNLDDLKNASQRKRITDYLRGKGILGESSQPSDQALLNILSEYCDSEESMLNEQVTDFRRWRHLAGME